MRLKLSSIISLLLLIALPLHCYAVDVFISKRESLKKYCGKKDVVMIASPGRSGSKMLTEHLYKYMSTYKVLKTHLLPPDKKCYRGKIIFIFSNPDQAAESVLYKILHQHNFGKEHFVHVETADRSWAKKLGGPTHQTEQDNLLSYDAFGTYKQLEAWLYTRTKPTNSDNAQILAIKYENLWDDSTVQAIGNFLNIPHFQLPHQEPRGYTHDELSSKEINFRKIYNLGTEAAPRYAAYDDARLLWEQAPPFQYLELD